MKFNLTYFTTLSLVLAMSISCGKDDKSKSSEGAQDEAKEETLDQPGEASSEKDDKKKSQSKEKTDTDKGDAKDLTDLEPKLKAWQDQLAVERDAQKKCNQNPEMRWVNGECTANPKDETALEAECETIEGMRYLSGECKEWYQLPEATLKGLCQFKFLSERDSHDYAYRYSQRQQMYFTENSFILSIANYKAIDRSEDTFADCDFSYRVPKIHSFQIVDFDSDSSTLTLKKSDGTLGYMRAEVVGGTLVTSVVETDELGDSVYLPASKEQIPANSNSLTIDTTFNVESSE